MFDKKAVQEQYAKTGKIFPSSEPIRPEFPKTYKTYHGCWFRHSGVVYEKTNHNLEVALWRQSNSREPDIPGLETQLRANNVQFFSYDTIHAPLLRAYHEWIRNGVAEMIVLAECRWDILPDYVQEVHAKRKQRMSAFRDKENNGELMIDRLPDRFFDYFEICLKLYETAKNGKKGRTTGDYSTAGSLTAAPYAHFVKDSMSRKFTFGSGKHRLTMWFIQKATVTEVLEAFRALIEDEGIVVIFHSDDMGASVFVDGTYYGFNIDISSCDKSHQEVMLNIAGYFFSHNTELQDSVLGALQQAESKFFIRDIDTGRKYRGKLTQKVEISGHSWTTVWNCIAASGIGIAIRQRMLDGVTGGRESVVAAIHSAAADAGYLVSVECVTDMYGLQFLKMSPVYNSLGELDCITNLGVLLRTMGQCTGDLPGSGSLAERSYDWNASVVASFVNCGEHIVTATLRAKYPLRNRTFDVSRTSNHVAQLGTRDTKVWVETEQLARRYNVTVADLEEMCDLIRDAGFGDQIDCVASRAILALDYGL